MKIFDYIKKPFYKNKKKPISKNEYRILKNDIDGFLGLANEKHIKEAKLLLNDAYTFKNKIILTSFSLIITLLFFLLNKIYPLVTSIKLGYYLFIICSVLSILIFIIYLISFLRSKKELLSYKVKFNSYYKYHYKNLYNTNNYEGYLEKLRLKKNLI